MPIYDYLCSNCGQTTEVIHGIDAPGPRFCPACGAEGTLRKALTTPAFHFKGSGWAKKDRSSSSGAPAKAGATSSTESSEGTTKSPDSATTPSGGASATASKSPSSSED